MLACMHGHSDVLRTLIKHDATLDMQDSTGRTALMLGSVNRADDAISVDVGSDAGSSP